MKISEKEKIMLATLGIVGIGFVYYQFAYTPARTKINEKKTELSKLETDYSQKNVQILSTEKNKQDIERLRLSIDDISKKIYPDIWQPRLIKELSDFRAKANVDINFSYSEVTYAPISEYFTSKEEEAKIANTLETLIDEYNAKMPADKSIDYDQKKDEVGAEKKEGEKKEPSTLNVQQMKVTASFNGSYDNVMKFIKLVEDYKYLVAIPNISLSTSGDNKISGTLSMEFYSAPRLNGDYDKYFDWKSESKNGKDNPFLDNYSSISGIVTADEEAENESLTMTIRPYNSDMPSVMVGRPDDSTKRTQIYNDENKLSNVTVHFTEKDGKYFVKYKIDDKVYPTSGEGIDFIPNGNIKMVVNSEKRTDGTDLVAVKLNVKNDTKKKVEVEIKGDDKKNPRVNIITNGNVHYVSK